MEDYDFTLHYHPGKSNIVADALSRKSYGIVSNLALKDWKQSVTISEYDLQFYDDGYRA